MRQRDPAQPGPFLRRAVISIGRSATLHLDGDAPAGSSDGVKNVEVGRVWALCLDRGSF